MRQVVSTLNPFYEPIFNEYDWGQIHAVGWKNPGEDLLRLKIYPGQGDWIISALVLEAPDAALPRLFSVLARLKSPEDCPGWFIMKASLTATFAPTLFPTPLP
jgi:hypothetical protein